MVRLRKIPKRYVTEDWVSDSTSYSSNSELDLDRDLDRDQDTDLDRDLDQDTEEDVNYLEATHEGNGNEEPRIESQSSAPRTNYSSIGSLPDAFNPGIQYHLSLIHI